MTVHEKFTADMEGHGFDVEMNYNGRDYWTSPGVECHKELLQAVIRSTPVELQWDDLGKGLIVYPVAHYACQWDDPGECPMCGQEPA